MVGALLLSHVPSAFSQASPQSGDRRPLTQLSLQELGNIEVISVSKTPGALRKTPAAIDVITQEDIRRSGATTLPDVLRLAPGVAVARIDSDHWSVGIRGFGDQFSKSVLVLIDGRNVYTPLFAGIYWGAQDTLLEDIDRIEVIRGPGGTAWGANAVNGVINIITKSSKDTQGLMASGRAGTVDHGIGELRYGGGSGSALTYRVYGKGFKRGGEFHTDGHQFDAWHMGQTGFRVDRDTASDNLTIQGDAYKATEGQSVMFGSFSPLSDITSYEPVHLSGGNAQLLWRHTFASTNDVQFRAYYDRTSLLGPQLGETRNTVDLDVVHHFGGLARQDVRWGLGMHLSPSRFTQTVPTLDLTSHDETDSIYSVFAQDEIALVPDRVFLTVGAKLEHNNFTGAEVQPSLRMMWTPTERQSTWFAVTRAVRTPSQLEQNVRLVRFLQATPPTFLQITGSSSFQTERVVGYEAGYRLALGNQAFIDVSTFRNRHDDLESFGQGTIALAASPTPHVLFTLPYANGAAGVSKGFEVASDWKMSRWLQIKPSYSYLNIDVHSTLAAADVLGVIPTYNGSSPAHQAMFQALLTLPRGWEVDQTYRHVSALAARATPAYTTLDARVGYRFSRSLDVSVVGQNLLQDHHAEFGHDPGPTVYIKRALYAAVTWRQ
jgi:iron complex outermembrane receptor protein